LKENYYFQSRKHNYKHIKSKIIIEEMPDPSSNKRLVVY